MKSPNKAVHFQTSSILQLIFLPIFLISGLWGVFIFLTYFLGFPFPEATTEKFSELSFFSISLFSFLILLTVVPFQVATEKLSPIFYNKIYNSPSANFGISLLLQNAVISFLIIAFRSIIDIVYVNQLYIALITSIIVAIFYHRFWVLRCLYQPYLVYKYVETLEDSEPLEEAWLELFECTVKAIKHHRINDVKFLVILMNSIYQKCGKQGSSNNLQNEDIISLYHLSKEIRPLSRFLEKKW